MKEEDFASGLIGEFRYTCKIKNLIPNPLYQNSYDPKEPYSGKYSGYFKLKQNPKPISENAITINFEKKDDGTYEVKGNGKNYVGYFELYGSYDSDTGDMICNKKYIAKPVTVKRNPRPRSSTPTPLPVIDPYEGRRARRVLYKIF